MENRFYTPKPEEVHIGFECELSSIYNGGGSKVRNWSKALIGFDHEFTEESMITNGYWKISLWCINSYLKYHKDHIRVKYLDKEDIESFGFKFDATRSKVDGNFVGSYGNEKYYLDYSPYNYNGSFDPNVHLRIMKIKDFPITSYQNDYQFIYDGIIKNKSELKKLLIQLEIINE